MTMPKLPTSVLSTSVATLIRLNRLAKATPRANESRNAGYSLQSTPGLDWGALPEPFSTTSPTEYISSKPMGRATDSDRPRNEPRINPRKDNQRQERRKTLKDNEAGG